MKRKENRELSYLASRARPKGVYYYFFKKEYLGRRIPRKVHLTQKKTKIIPRRPFQDRKITVTHYDLQRTTKSPILSPIFLVFNHLTSNFSTALLSLNSLKPFKNLTQVPETNSQALRMCGGAILANLIPPRQQGRRITASDLWPNTKLNPFESNLNPFVHADSAPLKRPQLPSGTYPFL